MDGIYLTNKLDQQIADSSSFVIVEDVMEEEILQTEIDDRVLAEDSMVNMDQNQPEHPYQANTLGRSSRGTRTSTTRSGNNKHLDVEMLLEAYFAQLDGN